MSSEYNPIRSVDGAEVPCPSKYRWKEEDVSASDAGRTEDVLMHKNRIGQVRGLELGWNNITTADASKILNTFDAEYVTVTCLDPKAGGFITDIFYVGPRSAALYNSRKGLWDEVSFNIVRQAGTIG